MMSLILVRLLGRLYPVLSGQMPSYHVVRRQGVSYSGHPGSIMWVVTGRVGEVMAIVPVNNLQNLCLLILVSWWQALTSIVVGLSLQIVDCCRVGLSWAWRAPSWCGARIRGTKTLKTLHFKSFLVDWLQDVSCYFWLNQCLIEINCLNVDPLI